MPTAYDLKKTEKGEFGMQCPTCGYNNPDGASTCERCGSYLGPFTSDNDDPFRDWERYTDDQNNAYGNEPYPQNGPYNRNKPPKNKRSGMPVAAWVAIAVGAILILGIIAFVVVKFVLPDRNSSGHSNTPTIEYPAQDPTSAPTSVQTPTPESASTATPTPEPAAASRSYGPNISDLPDDEDLAAPDDDAWLPDYNTIKYVEASEGVCIYWYKRPEKGTKESGTINDGEKLTVLAQQSRYYLVKWGSNVGWVTDSYLADSSLLSTMPDIAHSTTYWIYTIGDRKAYVKLDHGEYYAYYVNGLEDGEDPYQQTSYGVSGRCLKIYETRFVWNGSSFATTKQEENSRNISHGVLKSDPDHTYDYYG